ncbi:hypothetical protein F4777DRAFT_568698 [Nemania sp. FL0916]|nr:hypothetical protein F4777DRAFT_568698 [Nemania sp. FL0916]
MISDLVRTLYFSSQRQEWNHESIPDSMFYTIYSGVINLITCGAPLNIYDRTGQTPCSWLMDSPWVDPCNELAKLCLPDVPLMTGNFKPLNLMKHLIWYSNFGEAAGCGPLSLAIVARDEERVQEILRLHPESLDEIDLYGNTSFHIAVHHPSCLRLILEAGGLSMLEKANEKAYVSDNITPLKVACSLGNKESVNILLTSGSRITSGALRVTDYTRIPDLLTILKQRRHELKQLALKNLTRTEAESIGLHKHTVLDVNAFKVQKLLQSRGLNVPLPLQVDDDMRCPSVYHLNFTHGRVGAFEMLWDLGFHAIDNLDEYHKSSIAEALYSFRDYSAARWLIEHGADYWTPLRAGYTPAHRFFDRLPLDSIGEINKPFELSELQKWLLEKFHQVRVGNACNCPCSISGCIPLSGLFRWDRLWGEPLRDRSWSYFKLFKAFRASLEEEDLLLFIRRMTFDALGLTHTCHCPVGWRDHNGYDRSTGMAMKYTFEEIEEINSEQGTLLDVFADLVNGFVQVAFEDHGGMPLIASDPDRFWIEHWLPRMEETLETLNDNKLTQEEISASEAIGVVWGPQPVQTIACGDEDVLVRYSPEWVMREMEKIMNE